MLEVTYLCVLEWGGMRVQSQAQVVQWKLSQEDRQWVRKEGQELINQGVTK